MTAQTSEIKSSEKGPAFEWWMVSFFAVGAGFGAFVSLLIPPFVTQATGNAADAGIVMAIVSLAVVLGPVFGGFADKYRAHRLVLNLGVFGMALGFAMYALSAANTFVAALDAIVLGASIAAISAVAPVFILSAGKSQELVAKQLTTLNLINPIGQVVGGAILAAAATAGMSFENRFWIASIVILIIAVITFLTSAKPAEKITVEDQESQEHKDKKAGGVRNLLFSTFGVLLLVIILSSVGNNGINNQIANMFPSLYGIDSATTSTLISIAGLLNIFFYIVAGRWLARSGAMPDYTFGNALRLVGVLCMALLGMAAKSPVLLVAASMQLVYQSNAFVRFAQPVLGVRFSPVGPTAASGWVIAAAGIGSFIGSLLGGWLADQFGFNAINWMAVISVGAAVLLIFVSLWPAERKKRAEEAAALPVGG
jgi:predicted MFS family arabinose efflux permease